MKQRITQHLARIWHETLDPVWNQRSPGLLAWGFLLERVTGIEPAL
ncbi:hypothetical protein PV341_19180 [Streptomyces sp. PA03-1a]|nr:hypothetical protein [Streptomyces sp. PA03-1a]